MLYHSTRSNSVKIDSAQAVLQGLAPDGGLYMPENLPGFDWKACLQGDTYEMATQILSAMLPDIPDMPQLVKAAYTGKFTAPDLTPTAQAGDITVLELFHGPTSAFKDVALCMLPQLLTRAKAAKGMDKEIRILTATSGDTGKAALAGFQDVPGVSICVFYPDGGVSKVQRAQMVTQEGNNVKVCAVRGNFDDAQTGVKKIFNACADGRLLADKPFNLSSANSINIGRLAPQITYYFKAYRDLLDDGKIALGDKVNFSVPTGNFGDILAGYLAKLLGLPVGMLICASNANNVLTDFIRDGVYNRLRPLHKTISPSMDILVSSNLERLLYLMSGGDTAFVAGLMADLDSKGSYAIPGEMLTKLHSEFWADYCDDQRAKAVIAKLWNEERYLCDPHTAAGFAAAYAYREATGDTAPMVVLSTASPYKFPAAVLEALGEELTGDEFDQMAALAAKTGCPIPKNLANLQGKPERHSAVIDKADMAAFALA